MPKQTFYDLCEEKKARIIDKALEEFSSKTFSQASLNRIIKSAGIPKGSFYQYFENKEDLYLYLIEAASSESNKLHESIYDTDPDATAFDVMIRITELSFRQANIDQRYTMLALLILLDDSEFVKQIRNRAASDRKTVALLERDKNRGLINPETNCELVASIISAFSLLQFRKCGSDTEKYLQSLSEAIKVIRKGVSP